MPEFKPFPVNKLFEISTIYTIYFFSLQDDFLEEEEHHNFWELIYAHTGKIYIKADDETIYLQEGDIFIHKPNQRHALFGDNKNSSRIFIASFECQSPDMLYFVNKLLKATDANRALIQSIISVAKSTFEFVENTSGIHNPILLENSFPGNLQILSSKIEQLLLNIYSQNRTKNIRPYLSKDSFNDPIIVFVIDFLDSHIFEDFTTKDIAKALNFSVSHITSYFKTRTHYSIIEYFNILKIEKARTLLKDASMNIAQISRELNFCDQHYFSTVFKKYMKMTPREYRRIVSAQ